MPYSIAALTNLPYPCTVGLTAARFTLRPLVRYYRKLILDLGHVLAAIDSECAKLLLVGV